MADEQIRFDDGAAYERYMGHWSQLVGEIFLHWLSPDAGLRWLDIGCGNGAFTQMVIDRHSPAMVRGIDPSQGQLAFARQRNTSPVAEFQLGDAMALPFADDTFDVAVMPLVIFFVPDPSRGVAEMARVVSTYGVVSAYAWDMIGGHFPYEPLHEQMRSMGIAVPQPPSRDASRIDTLEQLWSGAGLTGVETTQITVHRTFVDFDDYWTTIQGGPSVGSKLAAMRPEDLTTLKNRMRDLLPTDADGQLTCTARANAVKGRVVSIDDTENSALRARR